MASKYINTCSPSVVIREMQIKATLRYHPLGRPLSKNQKTGVGEDVEKMALFCTVGGKVKWYGYCGKQNGCSPKN